MRINTRISCVLCTHSCKPTFAYLSIFYKHLFVLNTEKNSYWSIFLMVSGYEWPKVILILFLLLAAVTEVKSDNNNLMTLVCNAHLFFKIKQITFYPTVLRCCPPTTNYTNTPSSLSDRLHCSPPQWGAWSGTGGVNSAVMPQTPHVATVSAAPGNLHSSPEI